jgi:hypothetical protein
MTDTDAPPPPQRPRLKQMGLDKAIAHAEAVAAAALHEDAAANHRQIAKWLTELKQRRARQPVVQMKSIDLDAMARAAQELSDNYHGSMSWRAWSRDELVAYAQKGAELAECVLHLLASAKAKRRE